GRHEDGLNAPQRFAEDTTEIVYLVEDFSDDVEGRGKVRATDAEENTDGLPDLGLERVKFGQGTHRTIEDKIFGPFPQHLLDIELLTAVLPERRRRVDFALHHIKFAIHWRQPAFGFHQDEAVHPVCDVVRDHWRGAVINIKTRDKGLKLKALLVSGIGLGRYGTASGACHRV